ncbi:hypothetical protein BDW59DRAFT_155908 [Aspergillus cavernicola]|uniref:Uncharacterized protein n=1 Tax=Aspergillus cavernicola TaxID=176166 RepID=A0ABR4J526_9EURO
MSTPSESYILPRPRGYSASTDTESITSLPSESTTASDLETLSSDYSDSDAEAEWQESIEQLELLVTMVIVPFFGKYLGRRCAYWSWTRFMEWKYPIEGYKEGAVTGSVKAFAAL